MNKIVVIFLTIFIVCAGIFTLHAKVVGSAVWGDGQYYYSFLRSMVIDLDLNFQDELTHFSRSITYTKTGLAANKYSIGPAFFWAPFFLLAHFLAFTFTIFRIQVALDGYSLMYQLATGVGSVFYGCLGLYFSYLTLTRYFKPFLSLLSVLVVFFSSHLFYYIAVDPINSHAISFFLTSFIVYLSAQKSIKHPKKIIALGVLTGFLGLVRYQDVLIVLPVLLFVRFSLSQLLFFCLSSFIAFLPQVIVWLVVYGRLGVPYLLSGETFYFLKPKVYEVLLSQEYGLFTYAPVLLFSILGLVSLFRKNKLLSFGGLMLFVLQTYLIASWHYWTQGATYGGRMFLSLMPFFIAGFASFLKGFEKYTVFLYPLFLGMIAINMVSIILFLFTHP